MERLKEYYVTYFKPLLILAGIIVALISFYLGANIGSLEKKIETTVDTTLQVEGSETSQETEKQGYVDIKGEVEKPGVYSVETNMRLKDLIDKAGGFTASANTRQVNLAQLITDEMVITIPNQNDEDNVDEKGIIENSTNKIDLNKANKEQLTTIKGVGEKKAILIIEYRTKVGKFKTIEDLANIKGFSTQFIETIKPFVKVKP